MASAFVLLNRVRHARSRYRPREARAIEQAQRREEWAQWFAAEERARELQGLNLPQPAHMLAPDELLLTEREAVERRARCLWLHLRSRSSPRRIARMSVFVWVRYSIPNKRGC